MNILGIAFALLGVLLSGCTTPQIALDHANHGSALVTSLNAELRSFRESQLHVASARTESIKEQERRIAEFERSTGFDDRIAQAAGRTDSSKLHETLAKLADAKSKDEMDFQTRMADLRKRLDSLLQPLPESATKLVAVQQALAALGSELSIKDRIRLTTAFMSEIGAEITKVKEAAEKTAAKKAPLQETPTQQ